MKKRLLLTLLPMAFLVAACGGSEPAPSTTSHATGLSTTSKAETTSTPATSSTSAAESTSEASSTTSTPAPSTGYAIECYLKASSSLAWWNENDAVTYAYVWTGTGESASGQTFLEAEFKEAYDDNKTLYFSVEATTLPEHVLLIRCDPTVVTALPTAWPEAGIWNQTNDGDVAQKQEEGTPIDAWYANLSVKAS